MAIKFALGENPKSVYHSKNQSPTTRMATAAVIREQLSKAKRYLEDQIKADQSPEGDYDPPEYDAGCEALARCWNARSRRTFMRTGRMIFYRDSYR